MQKLRRPPALRPGAHIRVLSLSAPIAARCPRRFARAKQNLCALGYRVSEGALAAAERHHNAGTAQARAQDFLDAWRDPEVDAILSVIGGYTTAQILDWLPFDELAERPKIVVGYSDTTSLLAALCARSGIVTFNGPALLPQFGEAGGPHAYTREWFARVLGTAAPAGPIAPAEETLLEYLPWERADDRPRAATPGRTRWCIRAGRAEGPLLAANLGTLLTLAGTPCFPDLTGCILALEDDEEEKPGTIDRFLTHLAQLGAFQRAAGVVLGRFPAQVGLRPEVLADMVARAIPDPSVPVLAGFETGHVDPICTLPLGVRARLDAAALELALVEPAVSAR